MPDGGRNRGPKNNKTGRSNKQQSSKPAPETPQASALQQKCLHLFRDAFRPDPHETETLQEVKGHLYNRDFATAFGKKEYLEVYASRWSPSRALGYYQILADLQEYIIPQPASEDQSSEDEEEEPSANLKVVCLGGGAGAEIAALATWWSTVIESNTAKTIETIFVDIADWSAVINTLYQKAITASEISRYASAAAKESNTALLSESSIKCSFLQHDVLNWTNESFSQTLQSAHLVTLLFTLNELYSVSMPQTQTFLARLTHTMQPDSLLLVVDSPGSYSTVSINGTEKKYPMQWLLDHTLIGSAAKSSNRTPPRWEKLESDDSRWFRLPGGLTYPIDLENMRYQIHLYRRLPLREPCETRQSQP